MWGAGAKCDFACASDFSPYSCFSLRALILPPLCKRRWLAEGKTEGLFKKADSAPFSLCGRASGLNILSRPHSLFPRKHKYVQIESRCAKARFCLRHDYRGVRVPTGRSWGVTPFFRHSVRREEECLLAGAFRRSGARAPTGRSWGVPLFFRHSEAKRGIPSQGTGCNQRGDPSHAPLAWFGMT